MNRTSYLGTKRNESAQLLEKPKELDASNASHQQLAERTLPDIKERYQTLPEGEDELPVVYQNEGQIKLKGKQGVSRSVVAKSGAFKSLAQKPPKNPGRQWLRGGDSEERKARQSSQGRYPKTQAIPKVPFLPQKRKVLWQELAMVQQQECLLEVSSSKHKIFILAWDQTVERGTHVELFKLQMNKLMESCNNSFLELLQLLEFKYGKLQVKEL